MNDLEVKKEFMIMKLSEAIAKNQQRTKKQKVANEKMERRLMDFLLEPYYVYENNVRVLIDPREQGKENN